LIKEFLVVREEILIFASWIEEENERNKGRFVMGEK